MPTASGRTAHPHSRVRRRERLNQLPMRLAIPTVRDVARLTEWKLPEAFVSRFLSPGTRALSVFCQLRLFRMRIRSIKPSFGALEETDVSLCLRAKFVLPVAGMMSGCVSPNSSEREDSEGAWYARHHF